MGKSFLVLIFLALQGFADGTSDVFLPTAQLPTAPPTPLLGAQTSPRSEGMSSLDSTDADTDGDDGPDLGGYAVYAAGRAGSKTLQETYLGGFPASPMPRATSTGDLPRSTSPKILILARYGLNFPFHEILSEIPKGNIVIFAPKEFEARTDKMSREEDFRQVIYIEEKKYLDSNHVELTAADLHKSFRFDRILFFSENDVTRVGRLNHHLRLTGMKEHDSLKFRSKHEMKDFVSKLSTPSGQEFRVPQFAKIDSALDLRRFIADNTATSTSGEYNPFIVVKRDFGAGSEDTRVLKNTTDLADYEASFSTDYSATRKSELIAETFVSGKMYHVDGLVKDGQYFIRASAYMQPPLDMTEGKPVSDYTLPVDDSLHQHLIKYAKNLLARMPPIVNGSFHLEVFHQSGVSTEGNTFGDIVFCEIAMRPGGGRISSEWETSYGFNFHHQAMRAQAGLALTMSMPDGSLIPIPFDEDPKSMMPPRTLSCGILFPSNGKTLLEFTAPTFDFLHDFRLLQAVGTSPLGSATSVCDAWADAVVIGATVPELHANVKTLREYVEAVSKWSE